MNSNVKTLLMLSTFCIAMAALESAVVVYLRALYYPDGFTVALKMMDQKILLIEIAREAATVVMLLTVAHLAGRNPRTRFAYFLMAFAVWDIFYYVWLKLFIDWPSSIFDWDILFLIPFTWLGPVLAPVICSVMMLFLSLVLLRTNKPIAAPTWILLLLGSSLILYTFLVDYGRIIIDNGFAGDYLTIMQNGRFIAIAQQYVPSVYDWKLFALGSLLILSSVVALVRNRPSRLSG